MPNQSGLVVSERVQLTVHLPRGSGSRTVEVSREATAEEVIAELAKRMGVEKDRWKLYARPEGDSQKYSLLMRSWFL